MPFRVPTILGKFKGKISSECISYNLEFQIFPGEDPRTPTYKRGGFERGNPPLGLSST
jgi:hypothetical protein